MVEYRKISEKELCEFFNTPDIEEAVTEYISRGATLVSVSYVGGCRASGYHVYHFTVGSK